MGPVVNAPAPGASLRLFVVHAPEDAWFVEGFLLKALCLPEDAVLVSSKLEPGAAIIKEIERGAFSPVTVVVVSPAFLASLYAQFANDLATHQSVETADAGGTTLVPAILVDCELPLLTRFRTALDFRDQDREHWEAEAAKLRKKLDASAPVVAPVLCPYPGIRSFTTQDSARFHGRDREVRDLLGRLRDGQRELYVIGPSGSGKSSLVAAGLVPSLRQSPALAGGSFLVRQMRPGYAPTIALVGVLETTAEERVDTAMPWLGNAVGRLLSHNPGHDRLLIIIDQLEELFTIAKSTARASFVAAIRILRGDSSVALVFTLRADFYAQLMESALWTDLDGQLSRLDVGPLRDDKLRTAIEAPARSLGVYFEPVLVERLLHDVADEPGALPLLQDTLLVLWHRRTRGLLRLAEYEAMSDNGQTGLAATVARRANDALNELSPGRREIARRVLLRLVHFGEGTVTTRRQQPRTALAAASDAAEDIDAVIHHLTDRRLVTTSGSDDADPSARVDLAHEVLLSAWPELGAWIRSRKDDEQRRRGLEAKAAEWVKHGRGQSRLLDADELREVRDWISDDRARNLGVSEAIHSLLACSEAALAMQIAEVEGRRRRWRRWVTVALIVLTGAVVAISTLAVITGRRSREAREQASIAGENAEKLEQQLARSYVSQGHALLMSDHPAQAIPYFFAARMHGITDVSFLTLFRWATQGLPLLQVVHNKSVRQVVWSPDGTRVATASEDGARVWDAVSGAAVTPLLANRSIVLGVAWSPDGKRVATSSTRCTARIWDAISGVAITPLLAYNCHGDNGIVAVMWSPDGKRVVTASKDGTTHMWDAVSGAAVTLPLIHKGRFRAVAWSPDGKRMATASEDGTARVWDAVNGVPVTPPLTHHAIVIAVTWSPDGKRVATASLDNTARVWDAVSGAALTLPLPHQNGVTAVAWSPDGKRIATASIDHTARVWDAASGMAMTQPLAHQGEVTMVMWSPDGRWVATASVDHTARVWDAISGAPVTPPLLHQGEVYEVAWGPDGQRVATASKDNTARVWNAVSRAAVTPPLLHQGGVTAVAWSPDGKRVATVSLDHTARVWDAVSGRSVTPPLKHENEVSGLDHGHEVAWSPDGKRLATASLDHTARVWDADSGVRVTPPLAHREWVSAVAWSPDGKRLATASYDRTVQVWDANSGAAVRPSLAHQSGVTAVAWSPNGKLLVTVSNWAQIWDADSGMRVTPPLAHQGGVTAVAWSPDGRRVATAGEDKTARVWDTISGQLVTPPLAHQGVVWAVAWSPNGKRLATASEDGAARVWDVDSGQPVTPPLAHQAMLTAVAWSPDGKRLATASFDATARVWDADSGAMVTPPMTHQSIVAAVAWSPDGKRLATASYDATAQVWDVSWDTGSLADWSATLERCDYFLNDKGVLVARDPTSSVIDHSGR